MFYSHEVLTSRKYGVATVWLVATLGSKSNLKKINRKAILEVDVPKACQTIQSPEAPMALRLQSNLLYGVSRVYLQQCGYVLADAQTATTAMRMMLTVVKTAELDPEAGRARPDQLILEDDPSFLPDFALPPLDFDLSDLDLLVPIGSQRSGHSLSLTPYGSQQHSEPSSGGPVGGLIIPSTDSIDRTMGGFNLQGDDGRGTNRFGGPSSLLGREDDYEGFHEPLFEIDADGNVLDVSPGQPVGKMPATDGMLPLGSDTGASTRVRREHEEGQRAGAQQLGEQEELDFPMIDDFLPEGEAFPTTTQAQPREHISSIQPEEVQTSSAASAPMRRKHRTPKIIPLDQTMELRNSDLSNWNTNYLRNMADASRIKQQHRAVTQAKKNAEYWIWGSGIGNIGRRLGGTDSKTPFDIFYGDALFKAITGINRGQTAGRKHDRDSGIDEATEAEARRKHPRASEERARRGDDDEGMFLPGGDEEVELPRDAPSALDDQALFSAMPWNITASIRGSSAIARSGRPAFSTSVGGPSSIAGPADTFSRRGSRMVSASPLHGRGQAGGLEALRSLEGEDEFGVLGHEDFGLPPLEGPSPSDQDYDLYAEPEPLPTGPGVRVREALDAEGVNFLAFVEDGIAGKRTRLQAEAQLMDDVLQAEASADVDEVSFEELFPPASNSRMVACQALMQVLALGTKGMLKVRQDEWNGEIGLRIVSKVVVPREEEGGEEMASEEE